MIWGRHKNPYRELEKKIGYTFGKRSLLETALTHRSYRFENDAVDWDNQRLEFLGDAALSLVAADYMYRKMDDLDEGAMTSFRSQITSGKALTKIARDLDMGVFVRIGKGEERTGGRSRHSTLEDALESVVGAAYLDGGVKAVEKIFKRVFAPIVRNMSLDVWGGNPKGKLQEYGQRKYRKGPQYRIVEKSGPPHAVVFKVEVLLGEKVCGAGQGRNKRLAEVRAAEDALKKGLK